MRKLKKPVNNALQYKCVAAVFFSSVIFNLLNWEIHHSNFVSGDERRSVFAFNIKLSNLIFLSHYRSVLPSCRWRVIVKAKNTPEVLYVRLILFSMDICKTSLPILHEILPFFLCGRQLQEKCPEIKRERKQYSITLSIIQIKN